MTANSPAPYDLCALAQELAEVASRYQSNAHETLQLNMYSSYNDDWDEIYVVSEDTDTGKQWQIVKVALAKLSEEARTQLNLQIAKHNNAIAACAIA